MHLLDPVGSAMEDLTPYVDSHSASRMTFTLKLGNKGLARLKNLESAKAAAVRSTPVVVAADVPASSPAELSGWFARNFTKGKQAEKNIYQWFEVFPALWDKFYPCPLLTGEGLQLPTKCGLDGVVRSSPFVLRTHHQGQPGKLGSAGDVAVGSIGSQGDTWGPDGMEVLDLRVGEHDMVYRWISDVTLGTKQEVVYQ
eukprot:s3929_g1.t1